MNETESKSVNIKLDPNSVEILKKVDSIHRESMINLGLALVSKTGYYKTLSGTGDNNLDSVTDLGTSVENLGSSSVKTDVNVSKPTPKKATSSWDDF